MGAERKKHWKYNSTIQKTKWIGDQRMLEKDGTRRTRK